MGGGLTAGLVNEWMNWRMKRELWSFLWLKPSWSRHVLWSAISKGCSWRSSSAEHPQLLSKNTERVRGRLSVARRVWKILLLNKVKQVSSGRTSQSLYDANTFARSPEECGLCSSLPQVLPGVCVSSAGFGRVA